MTDDPQRGGCTRDGVIVHRPILPATRTARIELARSTIADLLVPDDGDQLDAEVVASHENPALVTFRAQVTDESRAWELCTDVSEAILNAGFSAISFGHVEFVDGAARVTISVLVGGS